MSIPRDRRFIAARQAILGAIIPPVGFLLAGQKVSAIVSVLAAFMAAGIFASGDVGTAVTIWSLICFWAALIGFDHGANMPDKSVIGQEIQTKGPFSVRTDPLGMITLSAILPPMALFLGGHPFLAILSTVVLVLIVGASVSGWYSAVIAAIGWVVAGLFAVSYLERE